MNTGRGGRCRGQGVLIVDEKAILKKGTRSAGVAGSIPARPGGSRTVRSGISCLRLRPGSGADRSRVAPAEGLDRGPRSVPGRRDRRRGGFRDETRTGADDDRTHTRRRVPSGWFTGDGAYGQVGKVRLWLESRGVAHVLAVPKSQMVISMELCQRRAHAAIVDLPPTAWQRIN